MMWTVSSSSDSSSQLSTCFIRPPSWDAWKYALAIHVDSLVCGSIPLALLLYRLRGKQRGTRQPTTTVAKSPSSSSSSSSWWWSVRQVCCFGLAVFAASIPPLLLSWSNHYQWWITHPQSLDSSRLTGETKTYEWMGGFLLATFGFSNFFKICNAGFGYYPEGADATLHSWCLWFLLIPEPRFV